MSNSQDTLNKFSELMAKKYEGCSLQCAIWMVALELTYSAHNRENALAFMQKTVEEEKICQV